MTGQPDVDEDHNIIYIIHAQCKGAEGIFYCATNHYCLYNMDFFVYVILIPPSVFILWRLGYSSKSVRKLTYILFLNLSEILLSTLTRNPISIDLVVAANSSGGLIQSGTYKQRVSVLQSIMVQLRFSLSTGTKPKVSSSSNHGTHALTAQSDPGTFHTTPDTIEYEFKTWQPDSFPILPLVMFDWIPITPFPLMSSDLSEPTSLL
ncbi:hypothetical protein J0S82_009400 [Galemys pyrenaicus]|uniref:Uncharacterized protein n=1 Tax=Galemys pyrenaicus TaxID=202257 RepID=A0A8J6DG69_GALPY|nr:hypothetical protein J0S82_009400 [Galemys pyrenaicus]